MNFDFNISLDEAREAARGADPDVMTLRIALQERTDALQDILDASQGREQRADEKKAWEAVHRQFKELDQLDQLATSRAKRATDELDAARRGVEHLLRPQVEAFSGAARSNVERWTPEDDERVARFFDCDRSLPMVDMSLRGFDVRAHNGRVRVEQRAIGGYVGAGTLGSLVPTGVASEIYQVLLDSSGALWRMGPRIVSTTPNGSPMIWPRMTTPGTATITNEAASITESDPTLDKITTAPFKYGHLTKVSNEVMADSPVDIGRFVAEHSGVAMAKTMGTHFATGTGSGQPQGYITGAAGSIVAGGTITPPNLISLIYKLSQRYRENAVIVTNDLNAAYLRSYRTGGGGTLDGFMMPMTSPRWDSSTMGGGLETFAGFPVIIDNNIPAHGSGVASLVFGDFSRYLVHDAGLRFERSDQRYFDTDQVGFRALWRLDGKVLDGNAFVKYVANAN